MFEVPLHLLRIQMRKQTSAVTPKVDESLLKAVVEYGTQESSLKHKNFAASLVKKVTSLGDLCSLISRIFNRPLLSKKKSEISLLKIE